MKSFTLIIGTLSFFVSISPNSFAQDKTSVCETTDCNSHHIFLISNPQNLVKTKFDPEVAYGLLTEAKWRAVAKRYYQSRLRTNFNPNNDLLSLWDVQQLIGFPGIKVKESSVGNRQYWIWIDSNNPQRKIKATFNYHQLIDLKGVRFESLAEDFIQAESSRSNSATQ